ASREIDVSAIGACLGRPTGWLRSQSMGYLLAITDVTTYIEHRSLAFSKFGGERPQEVRFTSQNRHSVMKDKKVAVVTGVGPGLGAALARHFAEDYAGVFYLLAGRKTSALTSMLASAFVIWDVPRRHPDTP